MNSDQATSPLSPFKNKMPQDFPKKKAELKLVVETDYMTKSGDEGGIPVMSRAGKISILGDPIFINKDL